MPTVETKITNPDWIEHGFIWNKVCDCESFGSELKDFLKSVEYGERSFTSIDAYVQIRKATEIFGPMGFGWGIKDITLIASMPIEKQTRKGAVPGYQMCFKGTFWWVDGVGAMWHFEVMEDIFLDTSGDSMKKVVTGMITKALSYLGWNYDVFRGRFNDAKSFESPADEGEKGRLWELLSRVKPEAKAKVLDYHEKRGYLKSEVLADIKKIESALAAKEAKNAEPRNTDGDGGDRPVPEDASGAG